MGQVGINKPLSQILYNDILSRLLLALLYVSSVNLGVLICIECSGVHRSLGVYVSQVRSLTLDSLKPEWVERLKTMGNKNSNSIYEATLPKDFDRDKVKKDEIRQDFIMEKYTALKYSTPTEKERILEESKYAVFNTGCNVLYPEM